MDDSADAAALAGAPWRTRSLAPERSAQVLREALREHTGDLTIADAAARSGLPLRDAELGLHALLRAQRGHLSVTTGGELLFRFPEGLTRRVGAGAAALRIVGAGALGLVRWTARIALTAFLLGYGLVVGVGGLLAVALGLAALTEDSSPLEGFAYVAWHMLELVVDALYWSVHPLRAPDEFDDAEVRQPRSFYQRVNGFFLGPPQRRSDPQAAARLLVAEIRFRSGAIGLSDVVRVTGLAPEPASALVSRLLIDYDGTVEVTEDGAIVYRFAALRPSVGATPAIGPPAIWRRVRELPTLTGNRTASNVQIALLTGLVATFGWVGMWLGFGMWFAEVPFYGSLALLAAVLLRIPFHLARRRADRDENGRRALLERAYAGACEREVVRVEEFAHAWQNATDTAIDPAQLQAKLLEIGGDLEINEQGGTAWRFPTIELELGALAVVRAQTPSSEREVGEVEFTSLPADERPALPE
jgi:hypothetical protein